MELYYQDEWVTIYHGDCREILPELPKVDLVLTDPPFENYSPDWVTEYATLLPEHEHHIVFSKFPYTGIIQTHFNKFPLVTEYIWYYTDTCTFRSKYMPLLHHETISVFSKNTKSIDMERIREPTRRPGVKPHYKTNKTRGHTGNKKYWGNNPGGSWRSSVIPVQRTMRGSLLKVQTPIGVKPVELFDSIIPAYGSGLILDPFLGSGTTAYCAKKLNRKCIGIEIDEKYCEIAANRCRQSVMTLNI